MTEGDIFQKFDDLCQKIKFVAPAGPVPVYTIHCDGIIYTIQEFLDLIDDPKKGTVDADRC